MYTVTSRSTVIGHANALGWSPSKDPEQVFLQFLPTPEFASVKPRIDAMMAAAQADSVDHPYDAYPELVDLDLQLRDEHGLIVSSGVISIVEGTETMTSAPPHVLRQLGLEPISPLLFLSATFGGSLEEWEPERHKGKTPQPHAKRRAPVKKAKKRPAPKRHRRRPR